MRCGDYIDPQYYTPNSGSKGGRVVTVDIYDIWFEDDDIVSLDEIKNNIFFGGKQPFPICRYCFNSNIKVPVTNGVRNRRENKQQNKGVQNKKL